METKVLSKDILIISHANCDDGMGAAYAAWLAFGESADYWFAWHGSEPPEVKGKEVYVLDFSYSREKMIKMNTSAKSMLVLDHHKSAEADCVGLDFCQFDMTKSGAVLAWEYFQPDRVANEMFYHLQDQDLWKFECAQTKEFTMALRSYPTDFNTWHTLYQGFEQGVDGEFYKSFLAEGRVLLRYFNQQLENILKPTVQEVTINGIKGLCGNIPTQFASEAGEYMAKKSGTFGMTYYIYKDGTVKVSLRSTKTSGFDVSLLAGKFNGGGHVRASGCRMTASQLNEIITKGVLNA